MSSVHPRRETRGDVAWRVWCCSGWATPSRSTRDDERDQVACANGRRVVYGNLGAVQRVFVWIGVAQTRIATAYRAPSQRGTIRVRDAGPFGCIMAVGRGSAKGWGTP